ncbi:MAG: hypothetical protein GX492_03180 [Firmicutes bacterium]|nr:hypothetical protein [Bacillota bacterium]
MLERCLTLAECERILDEKTRTVAFVGQMRLSRDDVEKLGSFIRKEIAADFRRTGDVLDSLARRAPACIAAFLTGEGIWGYDRGDYWSAVSDATGLADPAWHHKLGTLFLEFLAQRNMPVPSTGGSHRFVAPILVHGGIPQSCLPSFFEDVVLPMVELDLTSDEDVRDELATLRQREGKRLALEREIAALERRKDGLGRETQELARLLDLKRRLSQLQARVQAGTESDEDANGGGGESGGVEGGGDGDRDADGNGNGDGESDVKGEGNDRRHHYGPGHDQEDGRGHGRGHAHGQGQGQGQEHRGERSQGQGQEQGRGQGQRRRQATGQGDAQEHGYVRGAHEWEHIPEDYESYRLNALARLAQIGDEIARLQAEKSEALRRLGEFSPPDRQILACEAAIEECQQDYLSISRELATIPALRAEEALHRQRLDAAAQALWHGPWNDRYAEALQTVPWPRLSEACERRKALKARHAAALSERASITWVRARLSPLLWLGLGLTLLGTGIWVLTASDAAGILVAVLGGAVAGGSWRRFRKAARAEKLGRERASVLSEELKSLEAKLAFCEDEIVGHLPGLPFAQGQPGTLPDDLVERLRRLEELYRLWSDCHRATCGAEGRYLEWKRRVEEIASLVGCDADPHVFEADAYAHVLEANAYTHISQVLEELTEQLAQSRQRRSRADEARRRLEQEIEPRLNDLESRAAALRREIELLDEQVCDLGAGDLAAGIRELQRRRAALRELAEVRNALARLASSSAVVRTYAKCSEQQVALAHEERARELESIDALIKEKQGKLRACPPVFPHADEPVRCFLLHGQQWAESWLAVAARAVESALREGCMPEETACPDLPERVVQALREWWSEWSDRRPVEDGRDYVAGGQNGAQAPEAWRDDERLSAPVLMLDPPSGDVKLVVDRQVMRLSSAMQRPGLALQIADVGCAGSVGTADSVSAAGSVSAGGPVGAVGPTDLAGPAQSKILKTIPLRAYRHRSGLVETSPVEWSLRDLSQRYRVSLLNADSVYRSWEVALFSDAHPFAAFNESGRQVDAGCLPRQRLWFLVPAGFDLSCSVPVVEEATPASLAGRYHLLLGDLSDVDDACLVSEAGERVYLVFSDDEAAETPMLTGGEAFPGLSSDGAPVYTGELPALMVPVDRDRGLEPWEVIVRRVTGPGPEVARRRFHLSEMPGVALEHGGRWAKVSLGTPEVIGDSPVGLYTVAVHRHKRGLQRFEFRFAVVPGLIVEFEPSIVLPFQSDCPEGAPRLTVTVIPPRDGEFIPEAPAVVVGREDDVHDISVPCSEDVVRGELVLLGEARKTGELQEETQGPQGAAWTQGARGPNGAAIEEAEQWTQEEGQAGAAQEGPLTGEAEEEVCGDVTSNADRPEPGRKAEIYHLPLEIAIPKVLWRLRGMKDGEHADWSSTVEEVWSGTWAQCDGLTLEVKFPPGVAEYAELTLDDEEQAAKRQGGQRQGDQRQEAQRQRVGTRVEGDRAGFNLLRFLDSLKAGPAVRSLSIRVFGPRRKLVADGPVIRVRSRWEVSDVCVSSEILKGDGSYDRRRLRFTWREQGCAAQRVLRMWRLWQPWAQPLTWTVADGATELAVECPRGCGSEGRAVLEAGDYLIHFDTDDPWATSSGVPAFPCDDANAAVVVIDDGEPRVKDCVLRRLTARKAEVAGVVAGVPPGRSVAAVLLGIVAGRTVALRGEGSTGRRGEFAVRVEVGSSGDGEHVRRTPPTPELISDLARSRLPEKTDAFGWVHWLGVFVVSEPPAYYVGILPDPALLEWPLDQQVYDSSELIHILELGGRVEVRCEAGRFEQPALSQADALRLLEALRDGKDGVEVMLRFEGAPRKVKIDWTSGAVAAGPPVRLSGSRLCSPGFGLEPGRESGSGSGSRSGLGLGLGLYYKR